MLKTWGGGGEGQTLNRRWCRGMWRSGPRRTKGPLLRRMTLARSLDLAPSRAITPDVASLLPGCCVPRPQETSATPTCRSCNPPSLSTVFSSVGTHGLGGISPPPPPFWEVSSDTISVWSCLCGRMAVLVRSSPPCPTHAPRTLLLVSEPFHKPEGSQPHLRSFETQRAERKHRAGAPPPPPPHLFSQ